MSNTRSGGQHENNMKIENIPLNNTKKRKKNQPNKPIERWSQEDDQQHNERKKNNKKQMIHLTTNDISFCFFWLR